MGLCSHTSLGREEALFLERRVGGKNKNLTSFQAEICLYPAQSVGGVWARKALYHFCSLWRFCSLKLLLHGLRSTYLLWLRVWVWDVVEHIPDIQEVLGSISQQNTTNEWVNEWVSEWVNEWNQVNKLVPSFCSFVRIHDFPSSFQWALTTAWRRGWD